jgi:SAM-dependent methyltransferase
MFKRILCYFKCVDCSSPALSCESFETHGQTGPSERVYLGRLVCQKCGAQFPIYKYVPVLINNKDICAYLPQEVMDFCQKNKITFRGENKKGPDNDVLEASRRWSFQWERFEDAVDFKDNYYFSSDAFFSFIDVKKEEYAGKTVLDLGVGWGKEIYHLKDYGCRDLFCLDIATSVFRLQDQYREHHNIHFILANILDLPFTMPFDVIISDHCLHHVPEVEATTKKLITYVKKGGIFATNYYNAENTKITHYLVGPLKKILFDKFSVRSLYYVSFFFACGQYIVIKGNKLLKKMSKAIFKRYDIGALFSYWETCSFRWCWSSMFDMLHAPSTKYFKADEVRELFIGYPQVKIYKQAETKYWCVRLDKK